MATRLDDLILNRGGMAMGEQSQTVTKFTNPTQRTAASQSATAPNPSGLDQSANARVNRALAIRQGADTGGGLAYDNANQTTRGAAESVANPAIAESLRRSLIEQQRLSGSTYGTQSLGDRRARARDIQANQANVTAGLGAMGQMRTAQVTAEGNRIGADADVLTRRLMEAGGTERTAMTEAGANSRSLLESETSRFNAGLLGDSNAEVARIQGQNQINLDNNLNPFDERAMGGFDDIMAGLSGPENARRRAEMQGRIVNASLNPQGGFSTTSAPEGRSSIKLGMDEYEVANSVADQAAAIALVRASPTDNNVMPDEVDAAVEALSNGVSLAQLPAWLNQKRQQAAAQLFGEQQTAADGKTQWDEAKAYRASVEQQRRDMQRRGVPMSDEQYEQLLLRDYTPIGGLGN